MPKFEELPPVPQSLVFMDKDYRGGVIYGLKMVGDLKKLGVPLSGNFLDFGCGWGRLTYSLLVENFAGNYVGIDIMENRVKWLSENITPRYPNYQFIQSDAKNDRYRKDGTDTKFDIKDAVGDMQFDAAFMGSVFTHMYADDIKHYLSQVASVMKPDGIFVFTCFLLDRFADAACSEKAGQYTMPHKLDDTCRFESTDDPLFAIAHTQDSLMSMVDQAGLAPISITYGRWSGRPAIGFQDWIAVKRAIKPE